MGVIDFIVVLFISILIASIFFYGFQSRGPWGAFWVFVLILFFSAWAGRLWITPVGPVVWGSAWLQVIFFVFIIALLIAAATPTYDKDVRESRIENPEAEEEATVALGLFFWVLLFFLLIAIITGLYI